MGFPCIEWKDLKGASISQKGEEEIAGPEPSPGFKVRVSSKNPTLSMYPSGLCTKHNNHFVIQPLTTGNVNTWSTVEAFTRI